MPKSFDPQTIVTEYARTLIRVKAKQVVRRPGFSRSDRADVEQDLIVHLLCQAQHFDPWCSGPATFAVNTCTVFPGFAGGAKAETSTRRATRFLTIETKIDAKTAYRAQR